jgi:hypothetical protein
VLEATGPGKGLAAPIHRFWLRFMVPIFGRISPDPSAYRYLAESVLAFGPGDPFLAALPERGMVRSGTHRFLLGATHLWVSNKATGEGVQDARGFEAGRGETPQKGPSTTEERVWSAVGTLTSLAVAGSLAWAGWILVNPATHLALERSRRGPLGVAALGAAVIFLVRALRALRRALRPAGRS